MRGLGGSMRNFSWVLVVALFPGCYGREAEPEPEHDSEEPAALVSECWLENSGAECELRCDLSSGESVSGECVSAAVPGELPLSCSCEGGPSDGRFFSLASCDDLEASMASVCAETSPTPACPSLVPEFGQACSHRQECWIEDFRGDCSVGPVRSHSVGLHCDQGVWEETGVGEEFCP